MDFALNPLTNDLDVRNNSLYFVEGIQAIAQQLRITFAGFYGEWFLDKTLFMPWFQDVLIKAPSFTVVQEIFKNAILNTQGVISLNFFNLEIDAATRRANLSFSANTTSGNIDFSQAVQLPVVSQTTEIQ